MNRFAVVGSLVMSLLVVCSAQAVDVIWDGGNGEWGDANWNTGQTALDLLGTGRGLNVGNGEVGTDVFINGGDVLFKSEVHDDFRWQDDPNTGSGTLSISGGATLEVNTEPPGDSDGHWSQFNAKAFNIDNATFKRTFTPTIPSEPAITILSGGILGFGGTAANDGVDTQVNLSNGGRIENSGIVSFGWYTQNHKNVKVAVTINDGHLDLHDADNVDFLGGLAGGFGNAELLFHYGWDEIANTALTPDYSINFTGPGSINVDSSGILIVRSDGFDSGSNTYDFSTITSAVTYEEVWDAGILQANGLSGLDGATFGDFFTVTGSLGSDGYLLTSTIGASGPAGDFDGDGDVDGADFLKWQQDGLSAGDLTDWETNYGTPSATSASIASVPEPASLLLVVLGGLAMLGSRRSRV